MISIVVLSFIIAQTGITIYLFNILKLKDNFERKLNVFLVILFFHLGSKLFILVVLKDPFLYSNNATGFGLSYGPLLYLTTRLYVNKPEKHSIALLHLLPFLLFTLIYFTWSSLYLFKGASVALENTYSWDYQWLVSFSLFVYPLISMHLLHKYAGKGDRSRSRLLSAIIYVMLSSVLIGLSVAFVRFLKTGTHEFDLRLVPYMCFAVIPVLIFRYKMQIPPAIVPAPLPESLPEENIVIVENTITTENIQEPEKRYKKSALDEEMMNKYEASLKKFMEKTKVYLESEISLEELAIQSKIPKHHLTQLLNERFKKNFYVFINEYRITEAIKRLNAPGDHVNILSLAYECGFNSKSSFNNYFKKVTGHTPSTYRKEQLSLLQDQ